MLISIINSLKSDSSEQDTAELDSNENYINQGHFSEYVIEHKNEGAVKGSFVDQVKHSQEAANNTKGGITH